MCEFTKLNLPVRWIIKPESWGLIQASPSCTGFDKKGKNEMQNSQPSTKPSHSPLSGVGGTVEHLAPDGLMSI